MVHCKYRHISLLSDSSEFTQQDDRKKMTAKRDRAITCVLCHDLHLTPMFSRPLRKDLFKGK